MRFLIKTTNAMFRHFGQLQAAPARVGFGKWTMSSLLWGALFFVAFAFCYAGVLKALVGQWWTNDIYSYGFLIPCISLYLVWTRLEKLRKIAPTRAYPAGAALLGLGLLMLVLGHAAAVVVLKEFSFVVTLAGVVLFLLGGAHFRTLLLPIGYLFLMIPIWEVLTDRLHLPFQIFSATIGVSLLQLLGFPAHQQGVFVELPTLTLEVAQVCSGVNYLIAVVAVGIPLAYLFLRGWASRILLVCLTVAIAILSNGFRVALIGILVHYGANGDIHGPFHILQGMFVSVVGYVALFGGVMVLSRFQNGPAGETPTEQSVVERPSETGRGVSTKAMVALSLIFLMTASYLHFHRSVPVPLKKDLNAFPRFVGEWTGHDAASGVRPEDGGKRIFSRNYRSASGETVHLYVEYLASQEQGRELIDYRSDALFRESVKRSVLLDDRRLITVNKTILAEREQTKQIFFWYDMNGKVTADRYAVKLNAMWEALVFGRTNGALIRVSTPLLPGHDRDQAAGVAERFIRDVSPELSQYLPGSFPS